MSIQPNQVVTIHYTVKDEEGNTLDTTYNREPLSFIYGMNQILPMLEEKIGQMIIGSKATLTLKPADAYGEYDANAVQVINRSEFPEGLNLEEGMDFVADTPDGQKIPFFIKQIDGDDITIDFNHPLAGKTLLFEVELVEVRDATPEELAHGHVHGSGGHQH